MSIHIKQKLRAANIFRPFKFKKCGFTVDKYDTYIDVTFRYKDYA